MKKNMLFAIFIIICSSSYAQISNDNDKAIGFKFYPGGITYKTFVKSNRAIEGVGYIWQYGIRVTGLYEFYGDIDGVDGLKWYAGLGAHIGFWNDEWKKNYPSRQTGVAIGVDGVLGIDYKIANAPLNLSLDWQPSFNLIGYNYLEGGWGGLGIRYTF
ncbi:MAG: hypothetical protein NTZ59_01170 [Bacteroidetes bacterium]|jgi:hypothetical protein|nr:hypothetical protein [Bacteroidota bacterium]